MSDDVVTITDLTGQAPAAPDAPAVVTDGADVAVIKDDAGNSKTLPDRAIEHDDGSVELPLFRPVVLQWRSQASGDVNTDPPVETVTFRRLTGKDVRTVMNAGAGDEFFNALTYAAVRGQFANRQKWLNVLDRMDGADAAACIRIAQYFLENGPRTPGPRTSPA